MLPAAICVTLVTLSILLIASSPAYPATECPAVLVIDKGSYRFGQSRNRTNDITDIATALQRSEFPLTLKKSAPIRQVEETIEGSEQNLKKGGVEFFPCRSRSSGNRQPIEPLNTQEEDV
jgi:hypothetical protein